MRKKIRSGSVPTREQMLGFVPFLNRRARWVDLDSGGMLVSYKRKGFGPVQWFRWLFALPETVEVSLDAMSGKVVRQMDGSRTLGGIIEYVSSEFSLGREDAEATVLRFLDTLCRHNLVGFQRLTSGGEGSS